MKHSLQRVIAFTLLVLGLLLVGCAAAPSKRSVLVAEVRASAQANPDATGRPSPVVVYLLSLRSVDRLYSTDIVQVLDGPASALAADLVSFRQLMMLPGEIKAADLDISVDTRFVAVVADLQNFKDLRWKDSVEIPKGPLSSLFKGNKATVEIDQSGVHIVRTR